MDREHLTDDELDVLLTTSTPLAAPQPPFVESCGRESDTRTDEALNRFHEHFASELGGLLAELCRGEVTVKLRGAERGTYGQFVLGQALPTCCAIVLAEPIQAEFFLALRPSILHPLLDRLLGCRRPEPAPRRPLSEIEATMTTWLIERMLARYREAWQQVLSLELNVDRLEHNAQQMRAMPGSDLAYLVRYDVRRGRDQGWCELCIPWASTQQMRERLAANLERATASPGSMNR